MTRITNIEPARINVVVKKLDHAQGVPLPSNQTPDAAGCDLAAAVPDDAPLTIDPGQRLMVPTGLVLELPPGTEAQVRPRSGLALKHGVTVLNSPGTIDADYRGEVCVILINLGHEPFEISRGERIAQLIVAPVSQADFIAAETLSETSRGDGGFGSTGQ